MISVSNDFKTAMTQPIKEIQAFINADEMSIRDEDDLISFKVSGDGGLCKSVMRKLDAKYLGEHNLLGKWVTAGFGVKLPSGAYEYINYGSFLVSEFTVTKDTGITEIVAYDKMINAMIPYEKLDVEYPIDLYTYTQKLCEACGLELGNASFPVNGDFQIKQELWENIDGITYRDIFVQIAQATASTCIIGNDNKVYFKTINKGATSSSAIIGQIKLGQDKLGGATETLTYDNMFKLKLEDKYGAINSVVIGRDPIVGEDVYLTDDDSVKENGITAFRIVNNEIIDKDRENAITPIFNALNGVCYYPFETTTEGLGWYEIGDSFNIENDTGDVFNTTLFNFSVTIDGSVKETLKTVADTKTQIQYQYATALTKRVKNTEILVNKQDGVINSLVNDVYEDDGVINEKFSEIRQDLQGIKFGVQNSGGTNLIKNSVMFAHDNENKATNWKIEGDGSITIGSNNESISKNGFTLLNKKAITEVSVIPYSEENPVYYSFSTKIKKDATGSCYVKIYNSKEEHTIPLNAGESAYFNEYELTGLMPKENYYIIEFYGTPDSNATFTDNMFAVGEYKKQWTQANGEVMNTNVNIDMDGITVRSVNEDGETTGDYTVISKLEFAGYSYVNGTKKKVFSLNKETTKVSKLLAEDEIAMTPIKIVPVTEGDLQGWAFVPYTEVEE